MTHSKSRTSKGLSRRHLLRGIAGSAIAIPFLPSLATPSQAQARTNKRFVALSTRHGGIWPEHLYPQVSGARPVEVETGYQGRVSDLSVTSSGGRSRISDFVEASSDLLTPRIAEKMMMIQGLDAQLDTGHNWGVSLGNNYASHHGDGHSIEASPTVDQVMAWSDAFYPDSSRVALRSIQLGEGWRGHISHNFENPASQSGDIVALRTHENSNNLFDQLFPGADAPSERPLIVDRVLESYHLVRNGPRISASDQQRLDDHIQRIDELQRRLGVRVSCGDLTRPTEVRRDVRDEERPSREVEWDVWTDLLAMGIMCGVSDVATITTDHAWVSSRYSDSDWHQDIAHQADNDPVGGVNSSEQLMLESHRNWFRHTLLALAHKLDVEEADGRTYLDNSLLMYTSESGPRTHDLWELPVITIGGAGGWFNTGKFYDYRNREDLSRVRGSYYVDSLRRPGLPYNRWLANVLLSMGVPETEWGHADWNGYGGLPNRDAYVDEDAMRFASEPLPMIHSGAA